MQIVSAGEETSILLNSWRKEGSKISNLRSNRTEGKQELTEPRLHIIGQLLGYERQQEESGPVTASHGATVPDNKASTQLIQRSPLPRWIQTLRLQCEVPPVVQMQNYLLVNLELKTKSLKILLYLQSYCPTIKSITSAEESIFSQSGCPF